ncbi:MAG: hypothetical protein K8S87_04965 [Planctomycetes bacterium]|nr:hypothetical protein [Planctomycetota bacterium]
MRNSFFAAIIIVLAVAIPCFAQDINDPRKDSDGLSADLNLGHMLFFGQGDSSDIVSITLNADFNMSDWALGIQLPVFLETSDFGISNHAYDEFSDFVQFLKYMRHGFKNKTDVYFRIGTLFGKTAKIGHGSIVADYYSDIDFDSPQKGFQFDWDFERWGFETIVNSITERNLLAARFFLRPFYKNRLREYREFCIGISFAADHDAPQQMLKDNEGNVRFDPAGNLKYDSKQVNFFAFDLEIPLISMNSLKISPYFDYIMMHNYGSGFHLGIRNEFNIPILGDILPIDLVIEYRNHQSGFMPVYFDSFYEIERFNYPLTISPSTKLAFVPSTQSSSGLYSSLQWGIKELFWIRSSIEFYNNDPQNLKNSVTLEAATETYFELKLLFAQHKIENYDKILERNEKSIILFNFSFPVKLGSGNLLFGFMFKRSWRLNTDTSTYVPVDVNMPYISYRMIFG